MIKVKELTKLLENNLNALANNSEANFEFILHANMGDYERAVQKGKELPKPVINGVFRPLQSTVVPVHMLNNFYMQLQLDLLVQERYIDKVQGLLMTLIENEVGAAGQLDINNNSYAYVFNMNIPDIGNADIFPHIGKGVPISTTVFYQFIKDGILSNDCKLYIDGEQILTLDYSIARARINQTENIGNSAEMESVISQQGLQLNLSIPYLNKSKVIELVEDIRSGELDKVYNIKYQDINGNMQDDYVLKDGSVSYQAGKVPTITASFLKARSDIYG